MLGNHLRIPSRGIETRTDGSRPHIDRIHQGLGNAKAFDIFPHTDSPSGKLLPQGHGNGILQLGPAHLYDIVELYTLSFQRFLEILQFRQETFQLPCCCHPN